MDRPEEVEAVSNLWSLPIFLGVAAALIGIYVAGSCLFTGTLTARRSFWCPFRHRDVQADFSESEWDGSLVDVQACTAFKPPKDVGCHKACLSLNSKNARGFGARGTGPAISASGVPGGTRAIRGADSASAASGERRFFLRRRCLSG